MSATIYEVAKRAGVSTATVSHVCNKSHYVSEELRTKVLAAMNDLHYTPNSIARGLRGGSIKSIGLVVPDCTNAFFAEIARAIDRMCVSLDYNIILCNTDNNIRQQSYYIDMLISKRVDGIIFISANESARDIQKCADISIPVVIVDRDIEHAAASTIVVNNEYGGALAANYLADCGFTKIACISGPKNISSSKQRLAGFSNALFERNIALPEQYVYTGNFHYSGGYNALTYFQTLKNKPQAVFACNDMMAIGFIHAALSRGIAVPRDVSVVGFDNMELSMVLSPLLTTIAQPIDELAEQAVRHVLEKIKGEQLSIKRIVLNPYLIERETCIKK